jgi:hypothetical protein
VSKLKKKSKIATAAGDVKTEEKVWIGVAKDLNVH